MTAGGAGKMVALFTLAAATWLSMSSADEQRPSMISGQPRAGTSAAGPVAQESYAWRPVAIGAGGFVTGLSNDDSGRTQAVRTDVYGAYVWDAARDRWRQLVTAASMPAADRHQNGAAEGVYEIAVAPSDPDRLYMAIKGAVYATRDRGAHWVRPADGALFPAPFDANGEFRFHGPFLAVDPRNPDLVLFGTPTKGLWRSTDGGARWSPTQGVPPAQDMRPAPGIQAPGISVWFERGAGGRPTGRIWAMSPGFGIFVSNDGGARFASLATAGAIQPTSLRRGAFGPDGSFVGVDAETQKVWEYRGARWADLTGGPGLGARRYAAVAIDPRSGTIIVFDEGGRAFRRGAGGAGARWWPLLRSAKPGAGDPPWLRVADQSYFATADVRFDPAVPDRIWTGAGTGVWMADLSALPTLNWLSQSRGIEEIVANDVVQPPGRAPLFAGWDFGIHLRPDLDRFSTGYGPRERVLIAAQQVAYSARDPRFLVTNASDTRRNCCSQDGESVLAGYSEDGGRSWTRFATLPQPPGTRADDPWRMAFGGIAVSAGDTRNIVWQPAFNRAPFYTTDRGRTWRRVVFPGETLPNTGSHGDYYLQRKTLVADPVASGVFTLVHSGDGDNPQLRGLWRTGDGGARWERVFEGEIAPQSRLAAKLRAVPGRTGHFFFTSGIAEGEDTRLRRSVDEGRSWSTLDRVDHVDDVAFGRQAAGAHYPTIFLSGRVDGRYGIWRSVDDARTWQRLTEFPLGTLDQVTVMEGDKDVFGRVYLGYKGSGWIYGQPARCAPGEVPAPDRACDLLQ